MKANNDIVPVFLGADLNCYNMARAFHEEYGVISYSFGRYAIGSTMYSKIVRFQAVDRLDSPDVMLETLLEFEKSHNGKKLILLGCTDDYVNMIMKNKSLLDGKYFIPYPDYKLASEITLKNKFYEYCEKYGVEYPKTYVCTKENPILPDENILGFKYPVIIKPSSSILYWKFPFDGMKKVYRAKDINEGQNIISQIYSSGYPESIIVQDTIPGGDSNMYVLTAYCGKNGRVQNMCLGHVLLEEHTPKGIGNHAAIITEYNGELYEKFKAFLENINYTGLANFDIKFDARDSSFRVFEINTRQGRSNYYVTASGQNLAEIITDDLVFDNAKDELFLGKNEVYWRYIPDLLINKFVMDGSLKQKALKCKKEGKSFSLRYKYDLFLNPRRFAYTLIHEFNHIKKFYKYCKYDSTRL